MRLKELDLTNFKGGTTSFNFDGKDSTLFGDNGVGKTRQKDALCWLLFDKDSQFNSKFSIKTVKNGSVIPKLDVRVSAAVEHNGADMKLEKTMVEKWTKKHGSIRKTFSGHTTSFSINGVPKTLKEYNATIGEIATEEIFKKFSSPFYFAETMHWTDRRNVLLEVCGDVPDDEILKRHPALTSILEGRSVDDQKVIIENRNKKIKKEIESIPAIIEELSKDLLEDDADTCLTKAKAVEDELSKQIETLQKNRTLLVADAEVQGLEVKCKELRHQLTVLRNDVENAGRNEEGIASGVRLLKLQLKDLETSTAPTNLCETCGQPLPQDLQRPLVQWEKDRGAGIKEKKKAIALEEDERTRCTEMREALLLRAEPIKKELRVHESRIDEIRNGKQARLDGIDSILSKVHNDYQVARVRVGDIMKHDRVQSRINELGQDEKDLAAEFESLAAQLDLIAKFTRDKVERLESKINSRFKLARFKLFDMQINGTLKECCEVTDKKGVPFTSGLNSGARNNLGIDIINTLSEHYRINLPIIIDNAESVTELEPTKSQVIRLEVRKGAELTLTQ
jgi:hypothetical protein